MTDQQHDGALRSDDVADAASQEGAASAPAEGRPDGVRADDVGQADAVTGDVGADAAAEGHAAAAADSAAHAEASDAAHAEAATDGAAPTGAGAATGAAEATSDEPDYQDQFLRARAELENVRKRARRDVAVAQDKGVAKLARELLPAIDDLERALAHAPEDDPLRAGVKSVLDRVLASLGKLGIEAEAPKGEAFDPHRHEAIAQQPAEGAASGTILEVYAPGYLLRGAGDDVLLRAAKVVVAA